MTLSQLLASLISIAAVFSWAAIACLSLLASLDGRMKQRTWRKPYSRSVWTTLVPMKPAAPVTSMRSRDCLAKTPLLGVVSVPFVFEAKRIQTRRSIDG